MDEAGKYTGQEQANSTQVEDVGVEKNPELQQMSWIDLGNKSTAYAKFQRTIDTDSFSVGSNISSALSSSCITPTVKSIKSNTTSSSFHNMVLINNHHSTANYMDAGTPSNLTSTSSNNEEIGEVNQVIEEADACCTRTSCSSDVFTSKLNHICTESPTNMFGFDTEDERSKAGVEGDIDSIVDETIHHLELNDASTDGQSLEDELEKEEDIFLKRQIEDLEEDNMIENDYIIPNDSTSSVEDDDTSCEYNEDVNTLKNTLMKQEQERLNYYSQYHPHVYKKPKYSKVMSSNDIHMSYCKTNSIWYEQHIDLPSLLASPHLAHHHEPTEQPQDDTKECSILSFNRNRHHHHICKYSKAIYTSCCATSDAMGKIQCACDLINNNPYASGDSKDDERDSKMQDTSFKSVVMATHALTLLLGLYIGKRLSHRSSFKGESSAVENECK